MNFSVGNQVLPVRSENAKNPATMRNASLIKYYPNYLVYFFFLISEKTFPQITFRHLGNWVMWIYYAVFCG